MLLLAPPEDEEPPNLTLDALDAYHATFMGCLRKIKSTFNPRGRLTDKDLWTWIPSEQRKLARLVAEYEERIVQMFNVDVNKLPGWDELEAWIERADETHNQRMQQYRFLSAICGQRFDQAAPIDDVRKKFLASPICRMIKRNYGQRWESNLPAILKSYSASSTTLSHLISSEKCQELAQHRVAKITKAWELIKKQKENGAIEDFVEVWSRLSHSARSSWLRSKSGVWQKPHQDVYVWAEGNQAEMKRLGPNLFLTSLLNVEDLSRPDYLPALLDSRAKIPPPLFREFDSRSIPFGLYTNILPILRCEGRMYFTSHIRDEQSYHVEVLESSTPNWSGLDPCNGLLSLEAQVRIYEFCASCTLDNGPSLSLEECESPEACENSPGTLLDRCYAPNFHNPDVIDLGYIKNLLQACLDEAHDDLWQLRKHEDFWLQRMREAQTGRSTSIVLLSVSSRIDIFTALRDLVQNCLATLDPSSDDCVRSLFCGPSEAHAIMSLEAALLSSQNDLLSATKHMRWPHGDITPTLEKLLKLLVADSPLIRIMGLPHVMRIIDREMQVQKEVRYSSAFTQTINDLAVIAYSLYQVTQYDLSPPPDANEHIEKLDELDGAWKARPQPWVNWIKRSLNGFSRETLRKLDGLWKRANIPIEDRHFQFWTIVDHRIEELSSQVELQDSSLLGILEMLRKTQPANPTVMNDPSEISTRLPDTEPTLTAKRKGKKRAQSIVSPAMESFNTKPLPPDRDVRLVIFVPRGNFKAWTFWRDLIESGPECPGEFSWKDFVASMAAIGYASETTTGSVYRFEYIHTLQRHVINFHRPHGNVLTAMQAKRQWRDRILRRVKLELHED